MQQLRVAFACVLLLSVSYAFATPAAANDTDPPAVKEFKKRIDRYVELHKRIEQGLQVTEETSNTERLMNQKVEFARALRQSRPDALQGDFFFKGVRPIFLRIIKRQLSGPQGAKARSMVLGEGNPKSKGSPAAPPLKVNTVYPSTAPVSTMPPSLLKALPLLPEELEYRFIGRSLILRDVKADLILDYIPNAIR